MVFISCLIIGIVAAMIGSLLGLGGGMVLVPSLLILHEYIPGFEWVTPQTVVGISLITMVFTSLSSSMDYFKKGRVDIRVGLWLMVGSLPGGMLGAWFNQLVDGNSFLLYFGILTIILSILISFKKKEPASSISPTFKYKRVFPLDGETYHYSFSIWIGLSLSFFVGVLSGFFGIGGGAFMVPAMLLLFNIPIHIATATSMFMIVFVSLVGASTHIALGHIHWEYALLFIPAAWIGGKLGARLNQHLKGNTLEWIFRIMLIMIGIRMIWNGMM